MLLHERMYNLLVNTPAGVLYPAQASIVLRFQVSGAKRRAACLKSFLSQALEAMSQDIDSRLATNGVKSRRRQAADTSDQLVRF